MANLDDDRQSAFKRLWQQVPSHLHAINSDKSLWTVGCIDALGDLLWKNEQRFSHHSTDLGYAKVNPFRVTRQSDARPAKQRPYKHSPVLAAKIQTEIDTFVLVGTLRRSYSHWTNLLVVMAKEDSLTRITCSYKRVNK